MDFKPERQIYHNMMKPIFAYNNYAEITIFTTAENWKKWFEIKLEKFFWKLFWITIIYCNKPSDRVSKVKKIWRQLEWPASTLTDLTAQNKK